MKKLYITLAIYCASVFGLFAQKHDYIWIHGQYSPQATPPWYDFYFDFNQFPPKVVIDSFIIDGFHHTTLTFSDSTGNLLFYTGGCFIRNRAYDIMENSENLNEGIVQETYCSTNGNTYPLYHSIVPLPFNNQKCDLFHIRADFSNDTNTCILKDLLYSRVDYSLNQGLGKVIEKNSLISTGCFQTVCANRHANGRDWWLLAGDNQADTFYRYLVTPDTILGPWVQAIENPFVDDYFFCGWNSFSPDGRFFAVNGCRAGVAVYDFDRCTGLLSNLRFDPRPSWDYTFGAVFSPDSRFLYAESNMAQLLNQYDLEATDFITSKEVVAIWDGFFDAFGNSHRLFMTI